MTARRARVIWGFLLAPLSAAFTGGLLIVAFDLIKGASRSPVGMLFYVLLFGAPPAYLAMLLVGLPAYFVITRRGVLRAWHVFVLGGLTGGCVGSGGILNFLRHGKGLGLFLVAIVMGLQAAATFWALYTADRESPMP
ncbi:MAG TPA: hypothetical protein VLH58_05420 [Candidatus Methylomirabilis sp.]|nr:hypothetical protein [Candidatus Methylomirabilis sp.]